MNRLSEGADLGGPSLGYRRFRSVKSLPGNSDQIVNQGQSQAGSGQVGSSDKPQRKLV